MTDRALKIWREFNCSMCGTTVRLDPDQIYDRYGYFVECTSRNGPCAQMFLDGWTNNPNYLCVKCTGDIQNYIKNHNT